MFIIHSNTLRNKNNDYDVKFIHLLQRKAVVTM